MFKGWGFFVYLKFCDCLDVIVFYGVLSNKLYERIMLFYKKNVIKKVVFLEVSC